MLSKFSFLRVIHPKIQFDYGATRAKVNIRNLAKLWQTKKISFDLRATPLVGAAPELCQKSCDGKKRLKVPDINFRAHFKFFVNISAYIQGRLLFKYDLYLKFYGI